MKKIIIILTIFGLLMVLAIGSLSQKDSEPTTLNRLKEKYSKIEKPSVDHSKFAILRQKFTSLQQELLQ